MSDQTGFWSDICTFCPGNYRYNVKVVCTAIRFQNNWLDNLSEQFLRWLDNAHFWSENVRCPTVISSTVYVYTPFESVLCDEIQLIAIAINYLKSDCIHSRLIYKMFNINLLLLH